MQGMLRNCDKLEFNLVSLAQCSAFCLRLRGRLGQGEHQNIAARMATFSATWYDDMEAHRKNGYTHLNYGDTHQAEKSPAVLIVLLCYL